jgi:DNA-directed RNA polymerase specialized sigma24 family protein
MIETTQETRPLWNKLMQSLDVNPRAAAVRYESIRRKLVRIFRARGHFACEELADRVIDRVARNLGRGFEFQATGAERYFYRVAHFLSLEASREDARTRRALKELPDDGAAPEEVMREERRLGILEAHVRALTVEDRRLLLAYYEGEGQARIENRRRLARESGMSLNTLRVRMHRIRAELERTLQSVQTLS